MAEAQRHRGTEAQNSNSRRLFCASVPLCLGASLFTAAPAFAQCPDGTPPPCRVASAASPARRPNPPIDDRFWLVLPFTNTSGAADAALLTQASVNLLYQDMSRWQDIRVVPDDRVADLVRSLPAGERDRPGLESGMNLARRVGAGKLLMGDFLALGGRAQLNAKVYDVRSGRQLRQVRDQLSTLNSLDSLTAGFGRVARGALDVRAGTPLLGSTVGTSSLAAYSEYVSGLEALNRLEVDSAHARFLRATSLDSTFALAHLRASQTQLHYVGNGDGTDANRAAALRFADQLPPRERALVRAYDASQRKDYPALCAESETLVRSDSTDAEAWVLRAACNSDFTLKLAVEGDSSRVVVRGDLTAALAAAKRVYDPDPTGPLARNYTTLLMVGAGNRCLVTNGPCPISQVYATIALYRGDTIRYGGQRWLDVRHSPPWMAPDYVADLQRRIGIVRDINRRTLDTKPGNWLVEFTLARLYCQVGDTAAAATLYRQAFTHGPDSLRVALPGELRDLAFMRQRWAEAVAYADSALALPPILRQPIYSSVLGRMGEGTDTNATGRALATWRLVLAGVLPDNFDAFEAGIAGRLTESQRDDFLQLSTLAAFRMRRAGPALDTAARHPIKRFQAFLARGDTARARAALADYDRELLARHPATPDDGGWLFDAESHLELGDSATALARLVEWERHWVFLARGGDILEDQYFQRGTQRLFGRTWLLYGDLAMAAGKRDEARRAYTYVTTVWDKADAPLQPAVARARAALARL